MTSPDHPCIHEGDISILKSAMLEVKDSLKSITALLTSNAVLEEQVNTLRTQNHSMGTRLSSLELAVARQKGAYRWVDRIVWAIASIGVVGIFALK